MQGSSSADNYLIMSSIARPSRQARLTLGVLLSVLAIGVAAHAKPGSRPGTKGTYALKFTGAFQGTGSAKVNPDHIKLSGDLWDANGTAVTLEANKLKLDDGRLDGTGTIGGQPADITGRVDAAEGGVVKVARLIITVQTKDGRFCRGFGEITEKDD